MTTPFHAGFLTLEDNRTIATHFVVDIKGYAHLNEGIGKPSRIPYTAEELYQAYKDLWRTYFQANPQYINALKNEQVQDHLAMLNNTEINQYQAVNELLIELADLGNTYVQ